MTKKLLYFLSPRHNRSAIAEAWSEKSGLVNWIFKSGGWKACMRDPLSVKAMREVNIDLTNKPTDFLNDDMLEAATYIVAIYDLDTNTEPPLSPKLKHKLVTWNIQDPVRSAKSQGEMWTNYQEVCDLIAENVKHLESSLKLADP
ncbi:low molecular weight phosphatase family protein [Bacillus sp. FJAT-50079]|uniref:low molecular weight phosphatase family protein n=1 Tax=Bacillus sp. FJAT-50079 TaxID=2833577 RepID=UPI001BCA57CC|nr:low molecular weight phosphatase family protein [Bacillus sp. FJAT-50079]MBS4210721.1 low molecular weight phosphatase family protein [Bacillus sp. FJAT-50079]